MVVSRPLPAPAFVSQALVKVPGLAIMPGRSRSRSPRISCTQGYPFSDDATALGVEEEDSGWSQDEMDAISALFDRPMRPKPRRNNPAKHRAVPLPLPHKTRLPMAPAPKHHIRLSSRAPFSDRARKNPEFLIGIAREIAALPPDRDASSVLHRWARFLRKGSLSLTIRELGHMGLPDRALQTLCWAQQQRQPQLFPDDRVLASAVQVLARFDRLKVESSAECVPTASRAVLEAMATGFVRAGKVGLTRRLLELARSNGRTLGAGVYVKLMVEAARTRDGYGLAAALVDDLGDRTEITDLRPQDCTAVMKVCVKLRRFAAVDSLFTWFKESSGGGAPPTVVMYTTVIHSRCREGRHREAMALVWEMERAPQCRRLDLPAYRVIVKLCVALGDHERALRYMSRLKEDGFVPTPDMYDSLIQGYEAAGRLAKCRQLIREAHSAGLKLHKRLSIN